MAFINPEHKPYKEGERELKLSTTGLEVELHLLKEDGSIETDKAALISKVKRKDSTIQIVKEIGTNLVEFGCYPGVETHHPLLDMMRSLQTAVDVYSDNDVLLYPFGTYPGRFTPKASAGSHYELKKTIFGQDRFLTTMRVAGFHHHFAFPKGVFDKKEKLLKLKRGKLNRSLAGMYNFEIAADPALTLFAQSSPFYQGEHIGKDSRMLVYRGGKKLYPPGVYSGMQQIGGLPAYKHTGTDIMSYLDRQQARWKREVLEADPKANFNKLYPYKMDIGWQPVKLNKHGTLEQRGMDVNLPSVITSITLLLKYTLRHIQREFIEVIPADHGIDSPFKIENGIMYIPPQSYVRTELQNYSAYEGFNNKDLLAYTKRFFTLGKALLPKEYYGLVKPLQQMIETKTSISDSLFSYAKRKGFVQDGSITNDDAKTLALYGADKFKTDLRLTRDALEKLIV